MTRLRDGVRAIGLRVAPSVMADRSRRHQQALRERLGSNTALDEHCARHGSRVLEGPMVGLRYTPELLQEADVPIAKLTGVYEAELSEALAEVVGRLQAEPGSLFIDLGSADGYFAVGIAQRVPTARVIAFDLSHSARRTTQELSRANGTAVDVRGRASERALLNLGPSATALLCDIEGAEVDVLSSAVASALSNALVIVELHDGTRPGCTETIADRFRATHRVDLVMQGEPRSGPGISEMRVHPGRWAIMRPWPPSSAETGAARAGTV